MSRLNCETCGKRVTVGEAAARVFVGDKSYAWCFNCWDGDPTALRQYRAHGSANVWARARANGAGEAAE